MLYRILRNIIPCEQSCALLAVYLRHEDDSLEQINTQILILYIIKRIKFKKNYDMILYEENERNLYALCLISFCFEGNGSLISSFVSHEPYNISRENKKRSDVDKY